MASFTAMPSNTNTLPLQSTPFIGRSEEIADIVQMLANPTCRLLTLIGIGGIGGAADALEFIIAGAVAVQIGTMNFVDPSVWSRTLQELGDYCRRHEISSIAELSGTLNLDEQD